MMTYALTVTALAIIITGYAMAKNERVRKLELMLQFQDTVREQILLMPEGKILGVLNKAKEDLEFWRIVSK